jgi:hypothetical protein
MGCDSKRFGAAFRSFYGCSSQPVDKEKDAGFESGSGTDIAGVFHVEGTRIVICDSAFTGYDERVIEENCSVR